MERKREIYNTNNIDQKHNFQGSLTTFTTFSKEQIPHNNNGVCHARLKKERSINNIDHSTTCT